MEPLSDAACTDGKDLSKTETPGEGVQVLSIVTDGFKVTPDVWRVVADTACPKGFGVVMGPTAGSFLALVAAYGDYESQREVGQFTTLAAAVDAVKAELALIEASGIEVTW